ncbi:putative CRIB domain-containing protein [Helianthus annuus]|uniref:CRIB domain-containing protein n=1 Tax=Helianthus annuus TaxID=4232 RepID=A0A9K3E725_HELAN|nr:putative CRIB domain-containing protein [Helianthus annuus]KAJ0484959.1 putative CRIB domain-containing protein RIC1 [Helianthus annuus]KAJ0655509.1 putative CRIB domain-containing protein RIC1 [Helianthus annuus]KAJ0659199.1 putative CRIB domain-containing protein RIC1 [Helianthus annuus]KAJ0839478.1 putative CRIB domain-containing protein [Helianthus annuus]
MMKGLLRGLRCLFGNTGHHEKEPEIQIGAPTDVKHVAHIGCDGPSTPAPSWMNGYQSGSEAQPGETNAGSKDLGGTNSSLGDPHKARQSRRSSHGHESSNHRSRKNKSNNGESSANESSRTRRIKNSILGSETPEPETNVKKSRKKQGGEGTTRSSRTRNKDPSTTDSGCIDGVCQKPHD